MKQEEKQLLLQDLCARLPWGVKCHIKGDDTNTPRKLSRIEVDELDGILLDFWTDREDLLSIQVYLSEVKPYLRPMSSMTEDERKELLQLSNFNPDVDDICDNSICCIERTSIDIVDIANFISWLNAHHFDYRGLIERGLAIEVTEENNPYEK